MADVSDEKRHIKIITGLSGAGKTVVLRTLEDLGYYCIDNIPTDVILNAGLSLKKSGIRRIALGVDIREKDYLGDFQDVNRKLRESTYGIEIVFLDAGEDVLIRRFKETRRPHPLQQEGGSLRDAIRHEKEIMELILKQADRIIDTSSFTPHQLRNHVVKAWSRDTDLSRLKISLLSFGFKYGPPSEADILMDVRFLPNPHFVPELKPLTGLDQDVADFVLTRPETSEFLERFEGLLKHLVPQYIKEGKSMLNIALGCTGGRHRSPALVEKMAAELRGIEGVDVFTFHRELENS